MLRLARRIYPDMYLPTAVDRLRRVLAWSVLCTIALGAIIVGILVPFVGMTLIVIVVAASLIGGIGWAISVLDN